MIPHLPTFIAAAGMALALMQPVAAQETAPDSADEPRVLLPLPEDAEPGAAAEPDGASSGGGSDCSRDEDVTS